MIKGVTANTPAFQAAFTAALTSAMPTGTVVKITSVRLLWSDGTTTSGRRRELLQATVVGVQVVYSVYSATVSAADMDTLLASSTTLSAVNTNLVASIPGAVVEAPLVLVPTGAPSQMPTFAPSANPTFSAAPTIIPDTLAPTIEIITTPTVETNTFATPTASPTIVNTVIASQVWQHTLLYTKIPYLSLTDTFSAVWLSVSQYVTSASLTVAQAQSSTFTTAFVAGIQGAIPGVTVTVNSVSAARRQLLASVVVSYSASSATASTSALTSSLSSSTTIAAVTSSLVAAGYAGIVVTNLVVSTPITAGAGNTSPSAGANTTVGAIAGGVIGGLLVLAAVVGGSLFHIVHVSKSHEWNGCKLQRTRHEAGLQGKYDGGEQLPETWNFFHPLNLQPISQPREGVVPQVGETDSVAPRRMSTISAVSDTAATAAVGYTAHVDDVSGLTYFIDSAGTTSWTKPGELLPGWTAELDPFTGKMFYRHDTTQDVTWERPTDDLSLEEPPGKDAESSTLTLPQPRLKMAANDSGATTSGQRYEPEGTTEETYDELTSVYLTDIYGYLGEEIDVINTMYSDLCRNLELDREDASPLPAEALSQSFHYSEKEEATNAPIVSASLRDMALLDSSYRMVDATQSYLILGSDRVSPTSPFSPSLESNRSSGSPESPSLSENEFSRPPKVHVPDPTSLDFASLYDYQLKSRAPKVYVPDSESSEFSSVPRKEFNAPKVHAPFESRYFDVTYGYAKDEEAYVPDGKLPIFPADIIPPSSVSILKSPQKSRPKSVSLLRSTTPQPQPPRPPPPLRPTSVPFRSTTAPSPPPPPPPPPPT